MYLQNHSIHLEIEKVNHTDELKLHVSKISLTVAVIMSVTSLPAISDIGVDTSRTNTVETQVDSSSTNASTPPIDETMIADSLTISLSPVVTSVSSYQEIVSISGTPLFPPTSSTQTSTSQIHSSVSNISETPEIYKTIVAHYSVSTISGVDIQPTIRPPMVMTHASPSIHTILGNEVLSDVKSLIYTMPTQSSISIIHGDEPVVFRQNIIPNDVLTIVYDYEMEHNELIISGSDTQLSRIVVTEDTDEPKLNLRNLIDTDNIENQNITLTYPNTLEVDIFSVDVGANLMIETNTKITGFSEWDGVINLPIFVETDRIQYADPTRNVTSVLTVGLDEHVLEFDKPVRMVLNDKAGQEVGFQRGSSIKMIYTICSDDDLDAVSTQLGGSGECRIDVGPDLLVWTFHFTDFFTVDELQSDDTGIVAEPDPLLPDTISNVPRDEPRYTPRTSSGGGGGGGGSGIFRGDHSSGLSAVLDITSGGKSVLDDSSTLGRIHLEPNNELVMTPVIVSNDYVSNILRMDVLFHTDASPEPVAWIQYSALPNLFSGQMCDMPLLESDRIHTCDTVSLISGTGPSYTIRPDNERTVLQNLVIPFGQEFSGSMSVSILDSHGIELLGYDDATYHLNIAEYVEPEPVAEPEAPSNVIESEPVDPEPVNVNPEPTITDLAPADPEPDPTPPPPPPPAPTPTAQTPGTDVPPAGADPAPEDEDQFEFITEFGNNLMNFMNGLTHILFGGRP